MSCDEVGGEEPDSRDDGGAWPRGGGVFLAIGLVDLPRLPDVETATAEQKFVLDGFKDFVDPPPTLASQVKAVQEVLAKFGERETFEEAPFEALRGPSRSWSDRPSSGWAQDFDPLAARPVRH